MNFVPMVQCLMIYRDTIFAESHWRNDVERVGRCRSFATHLTGVEPRRQRQPYGNPELRGGTPVVFRARVEYSSMSRRYANPAVLLVLFTPLVSVADLFSQGKPTPSIRLVVGCIVVALCLLSIVSWLVRSFGNRAVADDQFKSAAIGKRDYRISE